MNIFSTIESYTNTFQDLMVRLSHDRGRSNSEHLHLAGLVEKSWMEIPAGGRTFYMRPNCQIEKSDKVKMLSLYVSPSAILPRFSSMIVLEG